METHSLALVMVVKNEEKGLRAAVESCRPFVQQVVIAVDNGSTDSTLAVAREVADVVKTFDFKDDFAAARNFAQEGVETEWLMFLDGHERVECHDDLQQYLGSDVQGLLCSIELENGSIFRNPRIYRNGLKHEGRVHERLVADRMKYYPGFLIKHDRLGSQSAEGRQLRDVQRVEQVPRVMCAMWAADHKCVRASFHLALHYQSIGQYKAGLKWWRRYVRYSKCQSERWYAFFNMSRAELSLGRLFWALWYAERSNDEVPGRWETMKLKGLIFYQRGKYARALDYLVNCFSENVGLHPYRPWARDLAGTWNIIGECLLNLGRSDRAALAFREAADRCENADFKKMLEARAKLMEEMFKSTR